MQLKNKIQDVSFLKNKNSSINIFYHKNISFKKLNSYFTPSFFNNKLYFNLILNNNNLSKILKHEKKIIDDLLIFDNSFSSKNFISSIKFNNSNNKSAIFKTSVKVDSNNIPILDIFNINKSKLILSIFDLNRDNLNIFIIPHSIWSFKNDYGIVYHVKKIEII